MPVKRQLLFVQGGGKGTHDEWDDKLVESLRRELGQNYEIHYPRMPNEEDPSYPLWKQRSRESSRRYRMARFSSATRRVERFSSKCSRSNPRPGSSARFS